MKKNCAFLLIYSSDGYFKEKCRIMISFRHNATFGFAGGLMEEGETPLEAAIRECWEETNYSPTDEEISKIQPLSELKTEQGNTIYSFSLELPKEKLSQIIEGSRQAKDSKYETSGFNDYMLYDESLENLVKFPFSGTAKKELKLLLKKINYHHKSKTLDELFL